MTEAIYEIEQLLVDLLAASDDYVIADIARDDQVFVQFAHDTDGYLIAEASATYYQGPEPDVAGRRRLHAWQVAELFALGWEPPERSILEPDSPRTGTPNFHKEIAIDEAWPPALLADLAVRTLHRVYGAEPSDIRLRWGRFDDEPEPLP